MNPRVCFVVFIFIVAGRASSAGSILPGHVKVTPVETLDVSSYISKFTSIIIDNLNQFQQLIFSFQDNFKENDNANASVETFRCGAHDPNPETTRKSGNENQRWIHGLHARIDRPHF
jgi:hypothetical protein